MRIPHIRANVQYSDVPLRIPCSCPRNTSRRARALFRAPPLCTSFSPTSSTLRDSHRWQRAAPMQLSLALLARGHWYLDTVVLAALWVRPRITSASGGRPTLTFVWRAPCSAVIGGRPNWDLTAPLPPSQPTQTNEKDGQDAGHGCPSLNTRFNSAGLAEPAATAFDSMDVVDAIKPAAPASTSSASAASPLISAGPSEHPRALPAEHIGTPKAAMESPVRSSFDAAGFQHPPASKGLHSRSMSLADVALQSKRLSLHFPIQTGNNMPLRSPPLRSARPTSWALDNIASALGDAALQSPTEGNFLTVIAAQERRVLELKDELRQAEEELKRMKDHYRKHEAFKKRTDSVRRAQQLEPLTVSFPVSTELAEDDEDGSSTWMQREMERRKALISGTRTSNRKVFSGSRHTRTLSLLSPERMQAPPFPSPVPVEGGEANNEVKGLPSLPRSATLDLAYGNTPELPDGAKSPTDGINITKDALLKTGKQMAADLKEGLWTFVEDLRQATVGDEGINGTSSRAEMLRRQNSTNASTKSNGRTASNPKSQVAGHKKSQSTVTDTSALVDIGGSFWREHGLESADSTPLSKKKSNPSIPAKQTQLKNRPDSKVITPQKPVRDFDDNWDSWDTPASQAPQSGSSTTSSSISESSLEDDDDDDEVSNNSSARTSSSLQHVNITPFKTNGLEDSNDKRDGIPWPALTKLSPSHLKRTASHLMSEWEKSLSPPANESRECSSYVDANKGEKRT